MGHRTPKIGDMIIKTCKHNSTKHIGIVHDIKLDSWGHQRNVLITWSDDPPRNYLETHGYAGVNIHNIRDEFEVIRSGRSIK